MLFQYRQDLRNGLVSVYDYLFISELYCDGGVTLLLQACNMSCHFRLGILGYATAPTAKLTTETVSFRKMRGLNNIPKRQHLSWFS